ncbi:MAG: type IV secretion system DNA-binding domain-containing protein [Thaumarchaeota archaeon]|nr:type IV secretion system DNA-binding domain-containing protein [Nitrososphaerota archaeon]
MGVWKLANRRQPEGALLDASRFSSVAGGASDAGALRARRVSVPTEVDAKRALENAGGLASERARSLEFWWDRPNRRLDIVLVAARDDMPAYEQDFMAAYVNATFEDCPVMPEWYDRAYYVGEAVRVAGGGGDAADAAAAGSGRTHAGLECSVFDVGYRHGHIMAAFDTKTSHDTVTQVSSVMQLARYGWIQMVFRRQSFTSQLQRLSSAMRSSHKEFTESKHYPMSDAVLLTGEAEPRDHSEKKADFVSHYQTLQSQLAQKSQDEQVMVSVRGLLESGHEVRLDWSGISTAQSSLEHLTANEYGYAKFAGVHRTRKGRRGGGRSWGRGRPQGRGDAGEAQTGSAVPSTEPPSSPPAYVDAPADSADRWEPALSVRLDGRKTKDFTRLRIFEDRLLPDAGEIDRPVSKYLAKSFLLGRYGTRRSPPFVVMTLPELGLLLRLPDTDATPNLTITRQQIMPQQPQQSKAGFCIGFFERTKSVECSDGMADLASGKVGANGAADAGAGDAATTTDDGADAAAAAPADGGRAWWEDEFDIDAAPPGSSDVASDAGVAGTGGSGAEDGADGGGSGGRAWWEDEFDIDAGGSTGDDTGTDEDPDAAGRADASADTADTQEVGLPDPMFGAPDLDASSAQGVVLSPEDIQTHIYMTGGTKSGKTTFIRCLGKHLELANLRGTFSNAFILIDPKGSDSYDFLRQCESESYDAGNVTFLDPVETAFSINVLELPSYDGPEDRQVVVSQYVGYIMQMIEYWYQGSDAFVRLKRILDTLLQYVYLNNDKPTFLDIYEIIVAMQQDGEEMLVRMYKELGQPEEVLSQAIKSVASMDSKSYEPALNRLEKFATDPVLRHMFCVRESTVRFEDLIKAGSYTIIRLSPLSIPQHIITLTKQTLVIKLWFAIQERAERVKLESERTQVFLALDEFQDLAGLPVIEAMLTQARSYGLGLLLAHQSTAQLDNNLFEVIVGNAGTQFVGRVSGRDAERFGNAWDPGYSKELKQQLATQECHHWTARLVAGGGESQPLPVQFWPVFVPPRRRSEEFLADFIGSQKDKYGCGRVGESMMRQAESQATRWLSNVPHEPPTRDEWDVMCLLREAHTSLTLRDIVSRLGDGTTASDTVSGILRRMVDKGLLARESRKYSLPYDVSAKYLEFKPSDIGTSEDIPLSTSVAVEHYLGRRFFLCVAPQKVRKGKRRTDLVAYDYETATPISVEIESAAEVHRHPEHVKLNMTKWEEMGFEECHVWSTHAGITGIYDGLADEQKKGVRLFVVGEEGDDENGEDGGTDRAPQPPPLRKARGRRMGTDGSDDDYGDNSAAATQPQ